MDTNFDSVLRAARARALEAEFESRPYASIVRDRIPSLDLPQWVEDHYPEQVFAIGEIMQAYDDGVEVVVLDAPTGCGKTLIAETVRQLLNVRGLYVCNSKSLQDQFVADFPYARVLKGRNNYPTMKEELFSGPLGISCADCSKQGHGDEASCRWCDVIHDCPYERAKAEALNSQVAVLNTRYFLTEVNGPGRFGRRDFVVADEADTLERELMGYVEFDIGASRIRRYGLGEPKYITKEDAWLEWVVQARAKMAKVVVENRLFDDPQSEVEGIREWLTQKRVKDGLRDLEVGLRTGNMVYTGKSGRVSFKPVTVSSLAGDLLWKHSSRWLLMSASIISAEQRLEDLGFTGSWKCISMKSPFRKEARKIVVKPLATMSKRGIENGELDRLFEGLARILDQHFDERVLLHTVSYELTDAVAKFVKRGRKNVFSYDNAAGRDLALLQFKSTPESVLVAPSMDRGIDLPGDFCRVVGVCRVPFPYLGDRQVNSRLHQPGGQSWYTVQTISSIIQMTGRGVRNREDWCTTYILDAQFQKLYRRYTGLFPDWWKEAIEWSRGR